MAGNNDGKLAAAMNAAEAGYRVHPLHSPVFGPDGAFLSCTCKQGARCPNAGKHPRVKDWPNNATTDAAQVAVWWKRWPGANIGAATGQGLLVLDVDGADGVQALECREVPATRRVNTGRSDGYHLHFATPPGYETQNNAGKLLGIDWRGDGGNVVLPGSAHYTGRVYTWEAGFSPADIGLAMAPDWLLELAAKRTPAAPVQPATRIPGASLHPWATAALANEIQALAETGRGSRNNRLNEAAVKLGSIVAGGGLPEAMVRDALMAACHTNELVSDDGEHSVLATIESGLRAGMQNPRTPPEPTRTPRTQRAQDESEAEWAARLEEAPVQEPEQTPAAIDVCTATSLLDRVADVEWLWPEWLPLGCVAVLAGEPGIGKSSVALSLAASQVTGTPWPDGAECTTRGPVLISDSEGAQALWAQRIRAWGVPTDDLLFAGQDGFGRILLDDERHILGVRELVRQRGVKLAIIDSLRTSLGAGVDENGSAVGSILAPWAELCRDLSLSLILVHHFGKRRQGEGTEASMDRLRGSSAIAATARSIIALDKPDPEAATVRLSCVKSNLGELPRPLGLSISAGGLAWTVEAPRPPKAETATTRAIEFLRVQLAHTPQRYGDLEAAAAQAGISKNSLYEGRRALGIVPVPDPTDPSGKGRLWGLRAKEGRDSSGWQ